MKYRVGNWDRVEGRESNIRELIPIEWVIEDMCRKDSEIEHVGNEWRETNDVYPYIVEDADFETVCRFVRHNEQVRLKREGPSL